jgi:drug/metabolite transporter (DMT)-like permease
VAVKDSLDIVPPVWMIALRFSVAAIMLGIIFFKKLTGLKAKTLRHGIFLSTLMFAAYVFQTIAAVYTTAGKNAFLTAVYVILTPLISWFLTRKRPGLAVLAAGLIALAGIGLISLRDDFSVNIGDALTLVCGFWYAVHIAFLGRFAMEGGDDPITLTVLQMFFTAVFGWLFALAGLDRIAGYPGAFPIAAVTTPRSIFSLLYLAVFSSSIAFLLQNVGQKFLKPSTAALLLSMEALFGALCASIFLHERMTGRAIVGCALLFFAILLSETKFEFLRPRRNGGNL